MGWQEVIRFWFKQNGEKQWWQKSKKFDAEVRRKFLKTYRAVVAGETAAWRGSPRGRLAEIIVLDQFARNIFRGEGQAFTCDPLALVLSQEAVRVGADMKVPKRERLFFYMPYMHSESKKVQLDAIKLFKKYGDKEVLSFARDHQKIVNRFGRFPHRNAARGSKSTAAERRFMQKHKGF